MSHEKYVAHTDMSGKSLVDRYCPVWLLPYAHLARWDRPIGTWLVLFPGWWGLALASGGIGQIMVNPLVLQLFIVFMAGAFLIRGAGCTVNDIWDSKIDGHVERTLHRPLPSGSVTKRQAIVFAVVQFLLGFILLLQLNTLTIMLGMISVIPICLYPLMKRVTWWPQLVLGLVLNWGALMGWAAVKGEISAPAVLMYVAAVFWTMGYDTIYAHQDKEDDDRLGMKSTALLFGKASYYWVAFFYMVTVLGLGSAMWMVKGYTALLVLAPVLHLLWQLKQWKIDDQVSCLKVFKSNAVVGWLVFIGMLV